MFALSYSKEGLLRQIFLLNQSEPLDEDVGKVEHWKGVHPVVIGWITVSFSHHQDKPTAFFKETINNAIKNVDSTRTADGGKVNRQPAECFLIYRPAFHETQIVKHGHHSGRRLELFHWTWHELKLAKVFVNVVHVVLVKKFERFLVRNLSKKHNKGMFDLEFERLPQSASGLGETIPSCDTSLARY